MEQAEALAAAHIEDIWNSQRYRPDLNYPIAVYPDDETEYRLTIEQARKLADDLAKAIALAEARL